MSRAGDRCVSSGNVLVNTALNFSIIQRNPAGGQNAPVLPSAGTQYVQILQWNFYLHPAFHTGTSKGPLGFVVTP